jgi:rhodanese-related sulfurtransferase
MGLIDEIPKGKFVTVFCPVNVRSAIVYAYLLSNGFSEVRIVEDGYSALTEALKPGQIFKVIQSKE